MLSNKAIGFLFVIIILLFASCTKPTQQFARERYIVVSKNLNIRIDPTQFSKTIGILSRGDTIIALASDKYWVMVKIGDQTGFVSNDYLKKLSPIKSPKIVTIIEQNANWKSWKFWMISALMISLWVFTGIKLMFYKNQLKSKSGISTKRISIAPMVLFVSGILIAVLYLFWKDEIVEALFYSFSIFPKGTGSIAWIIWIQFTAVVFSLIFDLVGYIYYSGFKYGGITFSLELGINLLIFLIAFFLTISAFIAGIIFIILFFSILYTITVTENSTSFSELIKGKI
jgi:hypothetical protein